MAPFGSMFRGSEQQSPKTTEVPKSSEQAKLPNEYKKIKEAAIKIIEQKIILMENPNPEETVSQELKKAQKLRISQLQESIERLRDDSFILKVSENNDWQEARDKSGNGITIDEIDKNLAIGLTKIVTMEH